jgi:hypothetical protein
MQLETVVLFVNGGSRGGSILRVFNVKNLFLNVCIYGTHADYFVHTGSTRRIYTLLNKQRKQFIYLSKVKGNKFFKNTV